nr:transporter substrate-binding domain-containing protein [uncultured Traorella sp.]
MRRLMASLCAASLILAGCSGNTDEDSTSGRETLRVGMECNYAPFNWTDAEANETNVPLSSGGYCDGYDVAIAKRIADSLGMDLEIVKMEWDSLTTSINSGIIDLIIAGMTDTPERRESIDFTDPYYESDMTIIVRSDSPYANATSLEDFSGATIAGQMGTLYDTVIDQIPNVNHATAMENYPLLVQALLSGVVDGVTAETPVGQGNVAANGDALTLVEFESGKGFDVDLTDTSVSIGIKKNSELFDDVQKALASITQEERDQMMKDAASRQPANEE